MKEVRSISGVPSRAWKLGSPSLSSTPDQGSLKLAPVSGSGWLLMTAPDGGLTLEYEVHGPLRIVRGYLVSDNVRECARLIARWVKILEHLSVFRRWK